MDPESSTDAARGTSPLEEIDDSWRFESFETVPLVRDTDANQCVSGDWSAEVKQENLAFPEQEPNDVCLCCVQHGSFRYSLFYQCLSQFC